MIFQNEMAAFITGGARFRGKVNFAESVSRRFNSILEAGFGLREISNKLRIV